MGSYITITRDVQIPDPIKIERYHKVPELGPRILFFSGGTALKRLSKLLIQYTHNSIHLITPFDSGGSSAKIRDSFNMISVGDLRNRLMALADQSVKGNPDIYRLFAYRLPDEDNKILINVLYEIIQEKHELIAPIPDPMKQIISNHIRKFVNKMPLDFDLSGANIGNLILTGGYLTNNKNIEIVLYIFRKLIEAQGIVKPIVNEFLHLVAELENGTVLVGQHLLTGKEKDSIQHPVKRLYLSETKINPFPASVSISNDIERLISRAEIICYPMGSFYSSVIANLIPSGVGMAVSANRCPKVYIPNTVTDPEQHGMNLYDTVTSLLQYLGNDLKHTERKNLLNFIIIDSKNTEYPFELRISDIQKAGIEIIDTELVTRESHPFIDSGLLINTILSLT